MRAAAVKNFQSRENSLAFHSPFAIFLNDDSFSTGTAGRAG